MRRYKGTRKHKGRGSTRGREGTRGQGGTRRYKDVRGAITRHEVQGAKEVQLRRYPNYKTI